MVPRYEREERKMELTTEALEEEAIEMEAQMEAQMGMCSICDALGHGYPGGPPCPLEVCDYSDQPWWAI